MPSSFGARRTALVVEGPEARKLLNDVLSASIPDQENSANGWAMLSARGKIQAEGLIGMKNGQFWLDVDTGVAGSFFKRLTMYKLRAKAEIHDLSGSHRVAWIQNSSGSTDSILHQDSRHERLGFRMITTDPAQNDPDRLAMEHLKRRMDLGIAQLGPDYDSDQLFPHDVALDLLGGVDFAKGCYVGQEVVSRMQHRGQVRKRPLIVKVENGSNLKIPRGQTVEVAGKAAGFAGQFVDGVAIGICRLDRLASGTCAMIGEHSITLEVPQWADYSFSKDSAAH